MERGSIRWGYSLRTLLQERGTSQYCQRMGSSKQESSRNWRSVTSKLSVAHHFAMSIERAENRLINAF